MRNTLKLAIAASALSLAAVSVSVPADPRISTVKGYVVDSACAFVRNVRKPLEGGKCARDCAQAGSPLVILTDDGALYWPISEAKPATGQNPKLMELAGQYVSARGKVFERGGSRAIVIDKIEKAPSGN